MLKKRLTRKVKTKVAPMYPGTGRGMSIAGTVKIAVVVAPNGTVKETKVVGGHPMLVNAAMDAVKKWKFEAGPEESTGTVEFKFEPTRRRNERAEADPGCPRASRSREEEQR